MASLAGGAGKKLIAWVRWVFAPEGQPGPNYCKEACGGLTCKECPRPGLLPENVEAVNLFHACETQWQYAGRGVRVGLNYAAIEATMRMRETKDPQTVFEKLQILEWEVLNIDAKRANDDQD